jgi:ADP-L-glycero-D-manno-heptose 6-epimerase
MNGARGEVLVTGAAGFIGSYVAAACRRAGWTVTGLDIRPPDPGDGGDGWITGPAGSPAVLREVRAGRYQAVVHQAGVTSTLETDKDLLTDVNVEQSLAIADACSAAGALFIYASSHSVYGKAHRRVPLAEEDAADRDVCTGPVNLYARSKLDLDEAMAGRTAGSPRWVGLRYTNVFGRGEQHKGRMASIISQLLRRSAWGEPLALFEDALSACRDYIPVEAVAGTIVALLEREVPAGVYNLGSGIPVSFATLVEWCASFSGEDPVVKLLPNPVASSYQYWTCADMAKLQSCLPTLRRLTRADIRSAAHELFQWFLSHPAPSQPAHAGRWGGPPPPGPVPGPS